MKLSLQLFAIFRNVRRFEPHESSGFGSQIDSKILIIPAGNVIDDEIMDHEYEVSHVVSNIVLGERALKMSPI